MLPTLQKTNESIKQITKDCRVALQDVSTPYVESAWVAFLQEHGDSYEIQSDRAIVQGNEIPLRLTSCSWFFDTDKLTAQMLKDQIVVEMKNLHKELKRQCATKIARPNAWFEIQCFYGQLFLYMRAAR